MTSLESMPQATVAELAARFGTPLYVYQLARVRAAAADLVAALPEGVRLYYSLKANPHPVLVAQLRELGLAAEISSAGELDSILTAGHDAGATLYGGPGKTPAEVRAAINAGVRHFSVESGADRGRLAAVAGECGVDVDYLLRVNGAERSAGGGLRMAGVASPFGVDLEDGRDDHLELLRPLGRARPVGVHLYPATNVVDPDELLAEFELSIRVAAKLMGQAVGDFELVDLGGGFAAPFAAPGQRPRYPGLRRALTHLLDSYLPQWRVGRPAIAFESGRHLVGDCGTLLATVMDVKRSRGQTFVVLDAGVHTFGGMSGLGRLLVPAAQPEPIGPDREPGQLSLVGPLCTPLDVLSRRATMAEPAVGSVVAIPNVGAYGLSASLVGFLSRPIAAEAVVEADGRVVSARRMELRETSNFSQT